MSTSITRYLGRTTPGGKRIVLAIAFDEEGVLDTITDIERDMRLTSTSYDGKRILRNADAIRNGSAPLGYWHTQPPAAAKPDPLPALLDKLDDYLKMQSVETDLWTLGNCRDELRELLREVRTR